MFLLKNLKYVCLILIFVIGSNAQELKLQDVLSKHRDAIGTADKIKALKNMVLLGTSEFESKLPQRKSVGKVAIVSDASNMLFISSFTGEIYQFEKIGLFNNKISIPIVASGIRSPLGDFLFEHQNIVDRGLFAGSMSMKWGLLDNNVKLNKMNLEGTKKVDGRKAYVVSYFTDAGSDTMKVRLFFDAETFQHIRSEYREEVIGKDAAFGRLGATNDYSIQLIENFSDFKTYDGVTVPTVFKVYFASQNNKGSWEYNWAFKVNEVKFNQPLKEGFFTF